MGERQTNLMPLVIISLAVFILVIDTTMMNVSISALIRDLESTIGDIQGVIAIYALIMASLMLLGAKLGDILGGRKVFVIGLCLYGIGTFIASMAWDTLSLLIGWSIFEGVGAALMLPATAVFITDLYKGEARAFAFGVWGGVGSFGAAIGPIIGGTLTTYASWRWGFRMELIFVVVILLMIKALPRSEATMGWDRLDVGGVLSSTVALGLIVFGILGLGDRARPLLGPVLIVAGMLLFAYFVISLRRRARGERPVLVDPTLFSNRAFTVGTALGTLQNLVLAGFLFVLPIFLQGVTGLSAFMTGVAILPMSILSFIVSTRSKLFSRIGPPRQVIALGMLLLSAGAVLMRLGLSEDTSILDLTPGSLVFGAGIGVVLAQVTNLSLSASLPSQSTDASGLHNSFKQLGTSLGTAIIGIVLVTVMFSAMVSEIQAALPGDDVSNQEIEDKLWEWIDKIEQGEDPEIPPEIADDISDIADRSFIEGSRGAFDALAIASLLGAILTVILPRKRTGY